MTWYAHQVFARPSAEVIGALQRLPGLRGSLYRIDHLQEYQREEQELDWVEVTPEGSVEHYRTVKRGPKVPVHGLLVVRELCAIGSGAERWFGDDATPWEELALAGPPYRGPLADLDRLSYGAPSRLEGTPPPGVLGAFRAVARSTRSVVSYFARSTWGGDTMYAYAWVWDGERTQDWFYRAGRRGDQDGALVMDRERIEFITDGDVLTLVLLHHGLLLTDRSFLPHTRDFPWPRYRLAEE